MAVPESVTTCGLPVALSVITKTADFAPGESLAAGAKRTLTVQLACVASVLLPSAHAPLPELEAAKSAAFAPLMAMAVTFRAALPVLETVTCCVPDAVPT